MENLHKYLMTELKKTKRNIKITYSSYHVPGEGEHKIINDIRQRKLKQIYCIYGLDADLIFLSLATQKNEIYLVRETDQLNLVPIATVSSILDGKYDPINDVYEQYTYVDIDEVKKLYAEQIINEIDYKLEQKLITSRKEICNKKILNDFIFLCYLLGNDFLPHLPSIDIKKNGLDHLINRYCGIFLKLEMKQHLVTLSNNIKINQVFLGYLLESLGRDEQYYFTKLLPDALDKTTKKRQTMKFESEYEKEIWELENNINCEEDNIKCGFGKTENWKHRYYEHHFGVIKHQQELIDSVCEMYLIGLMWVSKYYFETNPSWKWTYVFGHSPFVSDLGFYIRKMQLNNIKFTLDEPLSPCVQLLAVLPPESNYIVPNRYKKLMYDISSPIIDLYPTSISLDTINIELFWQCIPKLPLLDIDRIISVTNQINKTEGNKDKTFFILNSFGNIISL